MRRPAGVAFLLVAAAAALACAEAGEGGSHGGLVASLPDAAPARPVTVEGAERWLDGVSAQPHASGGFAVATRTDRLVQYPCTRCHQPGVPIADLPAVESPDGLPQRAHLQIRQAHGAAEGIACATCHTADDPAVLQVAAAEAVGLDRAYDLCGTCHFEQLRDWRGGAHGKRLAAWSGRRVVESCTGCHDPHAPAFPTRLPATAFPATVRGEPR